MSRRQLRRDSASERADELRRRARRLPAEQARLVSARADHLEISARHPLPTTRCRQTAALLARITRLEAELSSGRATDPAALRRRIAATQRDLDSLPPSRS